jgi:hypothetical protein
MVFSIVYAQSKVPSGSFFAQGVPSEFFIINQYVARALSTGRRRAPESLAAGADGSMEKISVPRGGSERGLLRAGRLC